MPENNHVIIIITIVVSNFLPLAFPAPRFNFIDSTQNVLVWATNGAEFTSDIFSQARVQQSPHKLFYCEFRAGSLILTLEIVAFSGATDYEVLSNSDGVGLHSGGRSTDISGR